MSRHPFRDRLHPRSSRYPRARILPNLRQLSSLLLIALLSVDVAGLQTQLAPRRISPQTNHVGTVILELLAGANGDSSIQFIKMEVPCAENIWGPDGGAGSNAMLVF